MDIIDAHTHIVSSDLVRYPFHPGVDESQTWHREHPIDADELLALSDPAGVRAVAFVQALSCHGFDNRYVLDSARRFPGRSIAVGAVEPGHPDAAAALRRDVGEAGMHGVRLFSTDGPGGSIDSTAMREIVAVAADLHVPVVLLAVAAQLPSVPELVAAFPTVQFVLDHCGFADVSGGDSFPCAGDLFALAGLPNLACKVTSITLQATGHPQRWWSTLVARFGSERLLWGSDFPHTNGANHAALVDLALDSTEVLSERERADVLSGTAARIWPSLRR